MEDVRQSVLKKYFLFSVPLLTIALMFIKMPVEDAAAAVLALLFSWTLIFYKEKGYVVSDIPLLFLLLGTISFGREFSLLGVQVKGFTIYITEILLAASLGFLVLKARTHWKQWRDSLPKGLLSVISVYFLLGFVYLVIGFMGNGSPALRDIVFCIYILFMFVTMSLFGQSEKINNIRFFLKPAIVFAGLTAVVIFFIYAPHAAFRFFIKGIKMTNLGLYFGMIFLFGLSFFGSKVGKTGSKGFNILQVSILYLSLLFLVLGEVRASWVGLLVSVIFLLMLIRKKAIILVLFLIIVILVAVSVVIIDTYGLTLQKNKLDSLGKQVGAVVEMKAPTMPAANIKWRLSIWKQLLHEIREYPVFGWGYGIQVDYLIWKKQLSWLRATGANTGTVPAHNHLLAITFKMGLVGLALFLFINIRIFFYGVGYIKKCKSENHRRFLIASLASLLHWHGMALFFDILESPPTGIFLWIILGAILAVIHTDKNSLPS